MAILVAISLENGGLSLNELHKFVGGNRLHPLFAMNGLEKFLEVHQDAFAVARSRWWYSEVNTMLENTGWWKSTCRMELA